MAASLSDSRYITAPDGLQLHVRDYGDRRGRRLPVVCLPGLTRTAEDFTELATALASDVDTPRRVLALDYRGRGLSSYDPNPDNYAIPVEMADVVAVIVACGATPAIFVGTSRGGLITMGLAAKHPSIIAGAVLNDIGPQVEPRGLIRIKGYVGRLPQPRSFEEGAELLRRTSASQFPNVDADGWMAAAKRHWREQKGKLVTTYDPALAKNLAAVDPDKPMPHMWNHFEALTQVPLMVVRGANSDILSPETVTAMQERHPDMDVVEIADQGHAPLLAEPDIVAKIVHFAAECDAAYAEAVA
jgi:pimeloyl-ACP methyl ester carboxylesterase